MKKLKIIFCIILCSALFFSCKRSNEKHTASGMKYIVHKENQGTKAKLRDFVTIEMVYKTETDSVLFDSRQNKMPMRFQLEKPPFAGSMEEGLTYMAVGDSATFFVSADSMVRKVFSKMNGGNYVRPEFLKTGCFLKFDIKLLRIQNELDVAQEMYHELDKRAAQEKANIELYLNDHKITQQADTNEIYIIKNTEGKGPIAESEKTVFVNYTGKFLNGEKFDSNEKLRKPYSFVVGKGDVIKGWDIEFPKLKQGDKVTMIVPSKLAYGEEGLRNNMNGTYIIQPNTPLLFELEVVAVK